MKILAFNNDANASSGASIISDENGKLEYIAISEERLSRVKNGYFFPARSIKYCMDHFKITSLNEFDYIATEFTENKTLENTNLMYRKLESSYINHILDIDYDKLLYRDHHLGHAASTFYPSGFEEAAIIVVDGLGSELNTNSLYIANKKDGIKLVEKGFGSGIGLVYTTVTKQILGFGTGEEGKTMGLAPLGRNVKGDKILEFNSVYNGMTTDYSSFVDRYPSKKLHQKVKMCENREDVTNEFYAKVAFEVQEETEKVLMHLAEYAYKVTGMKKLCFAGGVALNCVSNDIILRESSFDDLFVQPAASDTGIPFGLALQAYYEKSEKKFDIKFDHAYTGKLNDKKETKKLLSDYNISYEESDVQNVAKLLSEKNIVGFVVEGSEYGPRALGHRSILADARHKDMKAIINQKVKHREVYRPFAPSVLEEKADEYFILNGHKSPYMLLAPYTVEEKKNVIPAIVHVDGTARVQTVSKDNSEIYYNLISELDKITDIPVILNTSFNDNGEPIVETHLDALLCFLRTNIDYVYLDGLLINKKSITDIEILIEKLEKERSKLLKENYIASIKSITKNYNEKDMKNYLKSYLPMSYYYSKLDTLIQLQKSLNKNHKKIVMDQYHLNIIKEFLPEEYFRIKESAEIVEDCYESLEIVKGFESQTLVVLFNISLYINEQEHLENFYKDKFMQKLSPLFEKELEENYKDFTLSNEYKSSKDWEKFYIDIEGKN